MIRVMICDDIAEIRNYFAEMINGEQDMKVVCEAESGEEAVLIAHKEKPDVILMDCNMKEKNDGIEATQEIMIGLPETKIIILTIYNSDESIVDAYIAGAVDYLIKEIDADRICSTVRNAVGNNDFLGMRIAQKAREKLRNNSMKEQSMLYLINKISRLTMTERKIIKYLCEGKKRREIAKLEFVSEETTKRHIRHILNKTEFRTTAELVQFLKKNKLVEFIDFN